MLLCSHVSGEVMQKLLNQCATPEELVSSFKPMMQREYVAVASVSCLSLFVCSQLEMLAAQPPLLLQALGMPLEMIETELKKLEELEKLKVIRTALYCHVVAQ